MKDCNLVEFTKVDDEMIRKYIKLSDYQCGMAMGLLCASTILKALEEEKQPETA